MMKSALLIAHIAIAVSFGSAKGSAGVPAGLPDNTFDNGIEYTPEALADQITSLPGLSYKLNFNQFSGMLDAGDGNQLHYWFVESQNDAENDPVFYWTNGGPGCSGMAGLLTEMGPFLIQPDLTLKENKYGWSANASFIFVEGPAGVGYSLPLKTNVTDDSGTADGNYEAILSFFKKFPHLQPNDFHTTGESYAGHYLPTLSIRILDGNDALKKGKDDPSYINLGGFFLGNPYLNDALNSLSATWLAAMNGFIPASAISGNGIPYLNVSEDTGASTLNDTDYCTLSGDMGDPTFYTNRILASNMDGQNIGINLYAMNMPTCTSATNALIHFLVGSGKVVPPELSEACLDASLDVYLNDPAVQEALNIAPENIPEGGWKMCNDQINMNWSADSRYANMAPVLYEIVKRAPDSFNVIFSGDNDYACPMLGTQLLLDNIQNDTVWYTPGALDYDMRWLPWFDEMGQVGGFATLYSIPLITVRGAGHMVPSTKPALAKSVMDMYLSFSAGGDGGESAYTFFQRPLQR